MVSVGVECALFTVVQTVQGHMLDNRRKLKIIATILFTSGHEVVDWRAERYRTPYEQHVLSSEIAGCQQLFSHVPTVLQRKRLER